MASMKGQLQWLKDETDGCSEDVAGRQILEAYPAVVEALRDALVCVAGAASPPFVPYVLDKGRAALKLAEPS